MTEQRPQPKHLKAILGGRELIEGQANVQTTKAVLSALQQKQASGQQTTPQNEKPSK